MRYVSIEAVVETAAAYKQELDAAKQRDGNRRQRRARISREAKAKRQGAARRVR